MLGIEAGKSTQAELFLPAIEFLLVRFEEVTIQANLAEEFLSDRNRGWVRHGVIVESLRSGYFLPRQKHHAQTN